MPTKCSAELFEFAAIDRRAVIAGFDGGAIMSDAGALLLGAADPAIGLVDRLARCFRAMIDAQLRPARSTSPRRAPRR